MSVYGRKGSLVGIDETAKVSVHLAPAEVLLANWGVLKSVSYIAMVEGFIPRLDTYHLFKVRYSRYEREDPTAILESLLGDVHFFEFNKSVILCLV